jgi:hypothetical protein
METDAMNRPLLVAAAGLMLTLAACNNVDKEGTADQLIADIERVQNVTLDDAQEECVAALIDERSDEELRDIADGEGDPALQAEFAADLEECLRGTGATAPDGTGTTGSTGGSTSDSTSDSTDSSTTVAATSTTVAG